MNLRSLAMLGKVVGVLLVGVAVVGGVWGGRALLRTPQPAVEEAAVAPVSVPVAAPVKPRTSGPSTHPPITALRDRMLQHYHGQATNLFTDTPGFGFERMVPVYEKVPFEVPSFSPGELEVTEEAVKSTTPLMDVFAKSQASFRDATPPAAKPSTVRRSFVPGASANGFGFTFNGTVAHGLQLRMLDLVGLTDRQNPKAYSGGKAFEMVRVNPKDVKKIQDAGREIVPSVGKAEGKPKPTSAPALETRPLDFFEMAGVEELQKGTNVYIRSKDKVIRMLGALRASDDCLKCHTEASKGDLLGAFSYTFVDSARALTKEARKE